MQSCRRSTYLASSLACLAFAPLALVVSTAFATPLPRENRADASVEVDLARISQLVAQLGSQQFAEREKAQAKLRQLGLDAFDALYAAQSSDDIEISMRARYLLQNLTIRWAHDDDPPAVRELLKGYEGKADDERYNLMEQLIGLGDNQGLGPLCRLVRFDTSNELSKRGALLVARRTEVHDAMEAARVAESIVAAVGISQRAGAKWLLTFAETVENPEATLDDWQEIVGQEEKAFQYASNESSTQIVRELLHWQAELLGRCGREDQALAVILRSVELVGGSREDLLETVDWLITREAWPIVKELAERFPQRFDESPQLLYRLAESQRAAGNRELAEQTAERALEADSESPGLHRVRGLWLQELGLFAWSEREYRHVIETTPPEATENLEVRFLFSEMLHDLQREQEAGEILKTALTVLEQDEGLSKVVGRSASGVKSRMHYFFAEHFRMQGDPEQQLHHLQQGVEADPDDGDVLIALYRASQGNPEQRKESVTLIESSAQKFLTRIEQYEQFINDAPKEEYRDQAKLGVAVFSNQYAWLVSNTVGDYQRALRASQRSLELRPETAGYLDTLGRCYYALGDFDKAIEAQSRAVALEPHTQQIRRQLEFFEAARQAEQ
jgi:tetratricopeptide (TPR) repeat protein